MGQRVSVNQTGHVRHARRYGVRNFADERREFGR
jgi:hypothetical protein